VRDPATLRDAFAGVDVVVHLAFLITGNADPATLRAVNVDGTLNLLEFRRNARLKVALLGGDVGRRVA